jgi:hypothetical protein
LAGFADWQIIGERRAAPRTEKSFGLMFFENRFPRCWISEGEGDRNLAERE